MGEFCVLHLSDLHISSNNISATHKKLIKDIQIQTDVDLKILLVVSGDIVDRGEYKYFDGVIKFFEELYGVLKDKLHDLYIVPGNHDKNRKVNGKVSEVVSRLVQLTDHEVDDYSWNLQNENYRDYVRLIKRIYKIFKKNSRSMKTYGVEYCEIDDKIVGIIKLDTSWGADAGSNEKKKLVIGKCQREHLLKEYRDVKESLFNQDKVIDLTIAVAHHPLNWLKPSEEDWIKKYMTDDEYLNVDIFMCGHIHEMDIENWHNHEHSVMTLVTGIGWDHQNENEVNKDKKDNHRYSLYFIDIDKNTCEIVVRRTKQNGKFDYDYSLYTHDEEKSRNKLCYPIKISEKIYPFIELDSPREEDAKNLCIDARVLLKIQKISADMLRFQKNGMKLLEHYKFEYLERIEDFYDINSEQYDEVFERLYDHFFESKCRLSEKDDEIFKNSPEVVCELFTSFLQELSNNFVDSFKGDFDEGTNLRVLFRCYDREEDSYKQLCKYSSMQEEAGPRTPETSWEGMIKKSYESKKALIYSINRNLNGYEAGWDDFITIVPRFLNYEYNGRGISNGIFTRPVMSFGFFASNNGKNKKELSNTLYIMGFLNIDNCISEILDEFMKYFFIDYLKYFDYIKDMSFNE